MQKDRLKTPGWCVPTLAICLVASMASADVSYERLLNAPAEPNNWLTYSGDYSGRRYSRLDQINTSNVQHLKAQWTFQTGDGGPQAIEATPLVIDGILYVTARNNKVFALDARTGRMIWRKARKLPEKMSDCCGAINRGVAALGEKLFLATLDAHVVALDNKTGNVIWDVEVEDHRKGYSFTGAPLAVKDKIVVGISGGEFGIRGFIDAYFADSGKRAWRFYTVPSPGERGNETWAGDSWKTGSAAAWLTGTYDPELNLIYWGTGNPGPVLYGDGRKGDNLYSDCLVALDADTGRLRWYYQFTPHDVHDWDATQIPVLLDLSLDGSTRKLVVTANRNGFYYVLDRVTGQFIAAKQFARVTWARGIGADGRPLTLPGADPTPQGTYVCPGALGATNWMSPVFSPQTGLFYVVVREQCEKIYSEPQPYEPGQLFWASAHQPRSGDPAWGAVRAVDARTGGLKWEFRLQSPSWAGLLATAGGLIFAGDQEGYFIALDSRTGKALWFFHSGEIVYSSPIAFAIGGKQYLVTASGGVLFAFAL